MTSCLDQRIVYKTLMLRLSHGFSILEYRLLDLREIIKGGRGDSSFLDCCSSHNSSKVLLWYDDIHVVVVDNQDLDADNYSITICQ